MEPHARHRRVCRSTASSPVSGSGCWR
jgi:hypothetical protein